MILNIFKDTAPKFLNTIFKNITIIFNYLYFLYYCYYFFIIKVVVFKKIKNNNIITNFPIIKNVFSTMVKKNFSNLAQFYHEKILLVLQAKDAARCASLRPVEPKISEKNVWFPNRGAHSVRRTRPSNVARTPAV